MATACQGGSLSTRQESLNPRGAFARLTGGRRARFIFSRCYCRIAAIEAFLRRFNCPVSQFLNFCPSTRCLMPFQITVFDLLSNAEFAGVFGYERGLAFVVRVSHDVESVSRGMAKSMAKIFFRGDPVPIHPQRPGKTCDNDRCVRPNSDSPNSGTSPALTSSLCCTL
jgi:hypothetical protein